MYYWNSDHTESAMVLETGPIEKIVNSWITTNSNEVSIRSSSIEAKVSLDIKRVIHHDPATIIIWQDGTKTVVKRHNEPYDAEKGIAMAICKKLLGDNYHKKFREWCEYTCTK